MSRLAHAVLFVVLVLLLGLAIGQEKARTVHFSATHRGEGQPSLIEIRIEPPVGRREIYFSLQSGDARRGAGTWTRRRLQATEAGLYRLEHRFSSAGLWGFYMHYGSGLTGYDAYAELNLTLTPGETETSSRTLSYFPADAARLPAYVQPLGYGGFALLVGVLLFSVGRILARLRKQLAQDHARARGSTF